MEESIPYKSYEFSKRITPLGIEDLADASERNIRQVNDICFFLGGINVGSQKSHGLDNARSTWLVSGALISSEYIQLGSVAHIETSIVVSGELPEEQLEVFRNFYSGGTSDTGQIFGIKNDSALSPYRKSVVKT